MANNWAVIEPIVLGVAAALGIYLGVLAVYNAQQAIGNLRSSVAAARSTLKTGKTLAEAAATVTASGAQAGFNAALLACPITWIILAIIAVIAVIYAVVAAINKAKDTSVSATGIIMGAVFVLGAFIWNTVVGVINSVIQFLWTSLVEPWIGIIEWVLNVFNGGFNSFGDAVKNLLGNVISWFLSLGKVVTKIIDAIFGTNWTAGLTSLQNSVLEWGKNDNAITLSREAPEVLSRVEYGDAWNKGYEVGENLEGRLSNLFGAEAAAAESAGDEAAVIESFVPEIEGDTGSIAEAANASIEDLSYLRDLAEREAVNRYTTAEIRVEQHNENHIGSDMDIDGVMERMYLEFAERVNISGEGVYP